MKIIVVPFKHVSLTKQPLRLNKFLVSIFFLFSLSFLSFSQELNCKIQVLSQSIQGTDKRVFVTLQTAIYEFMNNKKWSNDAVKNNERIDCSILINVTALNAVDDFVATFQVQVRRPVFNSSYNSVLLNYNDNECRFKYLENQALEFTENVHLSNLTSILAYYAYIIIGLDYDTFALNGGTPYFQKSLAIVNNAQSGNDIGWKASENKKNRYWFVNNIVDASFIPIRECLYKYHRLGLDLMAEDKETGRFAIIESLEKLKEIHQIKPLSYNLQVFFNAKSDEIINIFAGAFPDEKARILNLVNEIDPTNSNKYLKISASQ